MSALNRLLTVVLFLALPAALVATNVKAAFNSENLSAYALDRYDAPGRTGLSRTELLKGVRGLIAYFNSEEELIAVSVQEEGRQVSLFNQRETLHLRDVKALLRGVYTVQTIALVSVVGVFVVGVVLALRGRREALLNSYRTLRWSALFTMGAIIVLGAAAAVGGFSALFLQFHLLSFANDLWILDPTRDRLIQMYPEAFFFDATMLIGLATVIEGALIALVSTVLLRRLGPRVSAAPAGMAEASGQSVPAGPQTSA